MTQEPAPWQHLVGQDNDLHDVVYALNQHIRYDVVSPTAWIHRFWSQEVKTYVDILIISLLIH